MLATLGFGFLYFGLTLRLLWQYKNMYKGSSPSMILVHAVTFGIALYAMLTGWTAENSVDQVGYGLFVLGGLLGFVDETTKVGPY